MLDPESETLKSILMSEEICSEDQMLEVEEEYKRTGKPLSEIVVDFGIIQPEELLQLIATFLGTDVIDLKTTEIEKSVIDMIDPQNVRMYGVVPVSFDGGTLTVASRTPLNYQIADELHFILSRDIRTVVASEAQIDAAIEKHYPLETESMHDMLKSLDLEVAEGGGGQCYRGYRRARKPCQRGSHSKICRCDHVPVRPIKIALRSELKRLAKKLPVGL